MSVAARGILGVQSRGILRLPFLPELVGMAIEPLWKVSRPELSAVAEWGRKRPIRRAIASAAQAGVPCLALEDGFLRSFGTGDRFPPLSIVVDECGVFYDSTRPSTLENLLNSPRDLLAGIEPEVARARDLILANRLSKYNHAPDWQGPPPAHAGRPGVLVVDQTFGDMSVKLGGADAATFAAMVEAARRENPDATVYVKTHPEVSSGRKGGYLTQVREDERTVVLREAVNPLSLIERMERVYVVSSTMGFEALLAGKPVTCFGLPWYAGWGATDDRQACPRRTRRRSMQELFAAAYFHYARYLDPATHRQGTIFEVIDWLVRQKQAVAALRGPAADRLICVGVPQWKAWNLGPVLAMAAPRMLFVRHAGAARRLQPGARDVFLVWGAVAPPGLEQLAAECGARLLRVEDGFVRSVGLGSDLIRPDSLVLDAEGLYFDPSRPSALERLLDAATFTPQELQRAREVRSLVVAHGLTKYNTDPRKPPAWRTKGRPVILVPGQVEDDASIRLGCGRVRTNAALLEAVRSARPEAFIVYKPHPDVTSGNRTGRVALSRAAAWADHVETDVSVVSCIEAADEVHTLTSLAGFDALLRGKKVVTYGQPFYAGWGLTEDRLEGGAALARRRRRLALDELVAGTLLRYPVYWDWDLRGFTTCEAALQRIVGTRDRLEASGELEKLRAGIVRRQLRKLRVVARAWVGRGWE